MAQTTVVNTLFMGTSTEFRVSAFVFGLAAAAGQVSRGEVGISQPKPHPEYFDFLQFLCASILCRQVSRTQLTGIATDSDHDVSLALFWQRRDQMPLKTVCSSKLFGAPFQPFMCFLADLMKRPNALSFFRLSRYDISWYSDSFLSFI
jgi:hypothetical protein